MNSNELPGTSTPAGETREHWLVDADGHVLEPPDLWARYVEPAYRKRAIRVAPGEDGRDVLWIDDRPARLTTPEMLGGIGCMGRDLSALADAATSGRSVTLARERGLISAICKATQEHSATVANGSAPSSSGRRIAQRRKNARSRCGR